MKNLIESINGMNEVPVVNSIQAEIEKCFNFTVEKRALSYKANDGSDVQSPMYGLVRSDNNECIGTSSVTDRYKVHQTQQVLELTNYASKVFDGNCKAKCVFDAGHKVLLLPSNNYRRTVFGTDTIMPRVMIDAPYTKLAIKGSILFFRDICMNLAQLETVKESSFVVRHTGSLDEKMEILSHHFSLLGESWATVNDTIDSMVNRKVDMVEFLNQIYPEPKEDSKNSLTKHRNRTASIFNRLQSEREKLGQNDRTFNVNAWLAFNAVQGYEQHDSKRNGSPSGIDRALRSLDNKYVRQAELLAVA